jgi:uncharacterized protein YdiU (UPF0061 family)
MPTSSTYRPSPRFLELGDGFSDTVAPAPFPALIPRFRNDRWAARIGLDTLTDAEWSSHFGTFSPLPENLESPLALRYHGHQFDVYNPRLGDGRGFLFAQLLDDEGRLLDLGTKGSGQTPWSRGGDGRLTLKGGVREILATEMLEALGVSTSKTLSLIETGEELFRGDEPSPTRSSVLVRLSHSHVRFGTFQRLAHIGDVPAMRKLVEYVTSHLVPSKDAVDLLRNVACRSAELCASWMMGGFVHGVLNSDNMNVTGESFDFGPYRFLPSYDPDFVAAYFDETGLYAFGRQPAIVFRNVRRLAEALTTIAPPEELSRALDAYEPALEAAVRRRFLARLSVSSLGEDEDRQLLGSAFDFLASTSLGYDQFFFDWAQGKASEARAAKSPDHEAYAGPAFHAFRSALWSHAPLDPRTLEHPYFSRARPCSLLIDEIERIWDFIAQNDDWAPLYAKIEDIRAMGTATMASREP